MSLFFALVLIGLPAAALLYDFYKGGNNTMLTPPGTAPQQPTTTGSAE